MMRNVNAILTTNAASASSSCSSISAPHPHRGVHCAAVGVTGAVAHNFMQMALDAFINDGANLLQQDVHMIINLLNCSRLGAAGMLC